MNGADLGPAVHDPNTGVIEAGPHITIAEPKHCDEYIEDPNAPECLRKFLERARSPAHGMMSKEPYPKLFADFNGKRVRVTMASTLGDVGIAYDLTADIGYNTRVPVEMLENFGDQP